MSVHWSKADLALQRRHFLLLFFAHPSSGWLLMAAGLPIGGLIETSRPGDHRTAHSATAGSRPVPSHNAFFGGAAAVARQRRSLIARNAGRQDAASADPHD